jgi:N-acetylglucosaminyl-diphospho-decaprenol L-rhamnosyltransferase
MSLPADIGIVVVNYRSSDLLARNLAGLGSESNSPRIVVVDNFSSTAERESLAALAVQHGWTVIPLRRNVGFGAAMNAGVARAMEMGAERFLLLNPDARIEEPVLVELARECAANPSMIVCPRIVRLDGSTWFSGGTVLVERGRTSTAAGSDSSAPGGWLTGACMMVSAELWRTLGGFDDQYFLYWEDVDLSWRCTDAGGQLKVRDDLTVLHSVGGSQEGSGKSPLYVYFNCRNRLLFAAKHLTRRQVYAWLVSSPAYAWAVMSRSGRRAVARKPMAMVSAAVRGTWAGCLGALRVLT